MAMVTVRNVSGGVVLVGERYLFPGESRRVDNSQVDCADKRLLCAQDAQAEAAEAQAAAQAAQEQATVQLELQAAAQAAARAEAQAEARREARRK